MKTFDRTLLALRHLFLTCANLILLAMLVANAVNIFWRAVAGTAFNAVFPWTTLAFVWLTFIGFYVYMFDRRDVSVDLIVKRLPGPLRRLCAILGIVVPLGLLLLILATAPAIIDSQSDRIDMVGVPRYAMVLPLFASAALVVVLILRRIPEFWRGLPADHAHPLEGAD